MLIKMEDVAREEDYEELSVRLDVEGSSYSKQKVYGSPIIPTPKQQQRLGTLLRYLQLWKIISLRE